MAKPPPDTLYAEPASIRQLRIQLRHGRTQPVIATGHQPTLWHPGVLAKDLAANAIARHLGGNAMHLVVDYDAVGPPAIELPTRDGEKLSTQHHALGSTPATNQQPANTSPPIDPNQAGEQLEALANASTIQNVAAGLRRIAEAYRAAGDACNDQAAQTTAVLSHLWRPFVGDLPIQTGSTALTQGFVDRLLSDPVGCVRAYNRAASAYPEAGIRPLYAGRDAVELPLWAQSAGPRTPVFADLGDSRRPQLFTQSQPIDLTCDDALSYLRPRALSLSALMRSEHCDLFIHGKGGANYDRVTQQWWQDWTGEPLAPMLVITADLYLDLDVPVADRDELRQAVWFDHHLPFNIDRYTEPADDAEAVMQREKRDLLDHMDDDLDKRRRSKAFKRIHAINAELGALHRARLEQASRRAEQARIGVSNRAAASRRDWCFALYEPAQIEALAGRIAHALIS